MDTSLLLMIAAALIAVIAVHLKSSKASESGIGAGLALLIEIAPRMAAAFTLAGLVQAVAPRETIVRWMRQRSGHRGILIGISRQHNARRSDDPLPISFLGAKLVGIRVAVSFVLPFIAGRLCEIIRDRLDV